MDADELLKLWRHRAQSWLHLANTWHGVLESLKVTNTPVPPSIVSAMAAQADVLEKQLASGTGGYEAPSSQLNVGGIRRPVAYESEAELANRLKEMLSEKNRRPRDLEDILGISKDVIERVLESYENLFIRSGDRGWWGLKK